jgi:glycosyltransferase involved in cell wall biosynthesis
MNSGPSIKICLIPRLSGLGGMVSFQRRLTEGLLARGIEVVYDIKDDSCDVVLVVGGTRHLGRLWRFQQRKIPIIQRLDGINWLHRIQKTSLNHFLKAEYGNLILRTIRNQLADQVVYQSNFVREWWQRIYGGEGISSTVIYNGVDLEKFSPDYSELRKKELGRILVVEGNVMGGYEWGLNQAVQLAIGLVGHPDVAHSHIELIIVGRVDSNVRDQWNSYISEQLIQRNLTLEWVGVVDQDEIPEIDRTAHLLYSSDVNPACPNSVIEALACGTPVLAFDTGALPELVSADAGRIVPYCGDPWKLEQPDIPMLVEAAVEILTDQDRFRYGARFQAERLFSLDKMIDHYIEIFIRH